MVAGSNGQHTTHRLRAWSVIVMGDDRQYAGNRGYADDPSRVYRYDSNVSNSRNVSVHDLLFIRDRDQLIGVGRVQRIVSRRGAKTMLRCPKCGVSGLKTRKTLQPRYRCDRGHEFKTPRRERMKVTLFEAHYAGTFQAVRRALPVSVLKEAAPRPSDQLAIEEIDPRLFEVRLISAVPRCTAMLEAFYQGRRLKADDSLEPGEALETDGSTPYSLSITDTRRATLRTIKARRGQRKFRRALMKRYGVSCMVTGCGLADLLEAAHIWPHRGDADNHVDNGLLLRADIHTLFDLNLLAIDPVSLMVHVAAEVKATTTYADLEGMRLRTNGRQRPARQPLLHRWHIFTAQQKTGNPSRSRSRR